MLNRASRHGTAKSEHIAVYAIVSVLILAAVSSVSNADEAVGFDHATENPIATEKTAYALGEALAAINTAKCSDMGVNHTHLYSLVDFFDTIKADGTGRLLSAFENAKLDFLAKFETDASAACSTVFKNNRFARSVSKTAAQLNAPSRKAPNKLLYEIKLLSAVESNDCNWNDATKREFDPLRYTAIAQAQNKAYDRKKALFATHEDISNDLVVAEEYGYMYGTTDLDVHCPVIEKFAKGIK